MRLVALLLALLACGAEDDMAARRLVAHQGPVHSGEGFRTAGQVGGQSFAAYQPPDQLTRPVPTTVPLGMATDLTSLGLSPVADRAYIARIKNIEDDIEVATVVADMGTPAAGTAVAGVALYEVLEQEASAGAGPRVAYSLRLLPGCEWFASVASGDSVPGFKPALPTVLSKGKSYAAAVVWNTGALLAGSGQVLNTVEARSMRTKGAVDMASGFPPVLPVDANSTGPIILDFITFRVRVEPARQSTLYYDFY
jgi:hypothetical protein